MKGPRANLKLVRRLARAYDRAIRAEEAAPTLAIAWRLAIASERALRALQCAQNGLPVPTTAAPRTRRNLALGAFAALASIGRAVARGVVRAASLAKAHAVNAAKRAVKAVARAARWSLRNALKAIAAFVSLDAPADVVAADDTLCDECGEPSPTVRHIDDDLRCCNACTTCVPLAPPLHRFTFATLTTKGN